MKILMVASECTPYAKTGGLADVIGALPHALTYQGHEVAVVLPFYRMAQERAAGAERVYDRMNLWLSPNRSYYAGIRRLVDRSVQCFFVDAPEMFDRPQLYGEGEDYRDNHIRFAVLCRAALGVVRTLFRPDIIHCHDWQTGLVAPYMREPFRTDPTFTGIANLMTIHNLGYRGIFPREVLPEIGLSPDMFNQDRMEFWGQVSFLKAGIVFADAVSTVSKGYAREIQTSEYGFGLDGLLRSRSSVLTGIVNGVDYTEWSPENDPLIAAGYSVADLAGKAICKRDLLRTFGLPDDDLRRPVIGIVSRLASQKGFDLIEAIADQLMSRDVSLIVLGTGDRVYEDLMRSLAARYSDKVAARIAYDNQLAHKIEAGSDLFLMPSQYEPCGLNQIYSLRYGTVPVVRATGGLDDTIDGAVGFRFREYSGEALIEAIDRALKAFRDPERWRLMMTRGMQRDHSWAAASLEYIDLYRRVLKIAHGMAQAV